MSVISAEPITMEEWAEKHVATIEAETETATATGDEWSLAADEPLSSSSYPLIVVRTL
jgi:hypothetical protein